MSRTVLYIYATLLTFLLAFILLSSSSEPKQRTLTEWGPSGLPQQIENVPIGKNYSFAGEDLEMDNFDVRERLERELMTNAYWHSNTVRLIKHANRFFPVIEPILAKNGVPDDFKYLAVAESGLANVVSPAGATGYWQFLRDVGKEYGLEVNGEIDQRYDIEASTEAACKLLLKLKDRFGSWSMAALAYNMGGANLKRAIDRQKPARFSDLNLNEETSRYVFRIVAIKTNLRTPGDFGFQLRPEDLYPPFSDTKKIKVTGAVTSWAVFAGKYDLSYRMLKVYNPWLRDYKLTNKTGKEYLITVPE